MKNKMQPSWWVTLATLGDVRFSSAPGSVASAVMVPFIYGLYHFDVSLYGYAAITLVFAVFSYIAITKSLPYFTTSDPKEIVLDECLGMLITFWAVPLSAFSIVVGFLLFRLFDISKMFGIGFCEKLPGTWGILCDDIAASIAALLALHFLVPVICG